MNATSRAPWLLCWLLFAATALSFLDRMVLSVLAPSLMREFSMSNTDYSRVVFAFQLSYTIMFSVGGRVMDWLGVRIGMALSVAVWSIASMAHALVAGPLALGAARLVLGFGEGAAFPGATKGAVEWFPSHRRALALGIANGGSAFGAMIASPLTAGLAAGLGWRGAFFVTGAIGLAWLGVWLWAFRLSPELPGAGVRKHVPAPKPDRRLLGVLAARFLFDPVFYFYMFWIPQYLSRERGFSLQAIGNWYWIPFLALGVANIVAGRISDLLCTRGLAPRKARFVLLTAAALLTPVSSLAVIAPTPAWAIALMALLMVAHGFWITNYLGLLADSFPSSVIATVTGLSGTAGGIGGMLASLATGPVVDRYSFTPVFVVCAVLYPAALALLAGTVPGRRQEGRIATPLPE